MRTRGLRFALLAVGLGLVAVLVARLGPGEIVTEVTRAGPGVIFLLVTYAAGTAIGALPWYVLLPPPVRPTAGGAIASRFAASGANAILPLFGVGGEPARLLWLAPAAQAAGIAAIVLDRLIYAAGSAIFLLGGAFAMLERGGVPTRHTIVGAAAALTILLGAVLGAWVAVRHRAAGRIHRVVHRLRGREREELVDGLGDEVDRQLEAIVARPGGALWIGLACHVVGRIVLGAEVYVGFLLLGVPLSPEDAWIFASVPVLLGFAGAVVPSQVGLQEGGQALVAVLLGVSPTMAVAVVLLQRIRQVASVSLAWVLFASVRRRREP